MLEWWRKWCTMELHVFSLHQTLLELLDWGELNWRRYVGRKGEMRSAYRILVGKPEGKWQFERHSSRWIILKLIFNKNTCVRMWILLIWLMMGTSVELSRALEFHKKRGISWLNEQLLVPPEALCFMVSVSCNIVITVYTPVYVQIAKFWLGSEIS